ncbi:hypothetical protein L3Q82_010015, partial [Scortum barcoo]
GDGDRKWSVHYTTQKPQQGLIFIPGKRRSGSADDLQACNGLTQHGCSRPDSSKPRPPSPSSSGLDQSEGSTRRRWKDKSRKMSSAFSDEDERFILNNTRPMTPLVLNPVPQTSCWDVFATAYEPAVDVELEPPSRLPTPEERMRQQAEAVGADIVLINVTGESFDRQASFRRVASNNDSLSRRPRNLSRRKTVTGIPADVNRKLDSPLVSLVLPGQFSTVGRSSSSASAHQQKSTGEEVEEKKRVEVREEVQPSARRIRAPRGEGMSSLMASLTSSKPVNSCHDFSTSCCSSSSEVHSLPRLGTNSSLNSEVSCNSASYRTLSASSSCCQSQDLQGFPSDLQPLLPFDPTARVIPQSPSSSSSSFPSSPVTSLPGTPSCALQSEWSYPSDKPLNEATQYHSSPSSSHYLSSSSIADSESQFSYQALDDQTATQQELQCPYNGGFHSGEPWSYQPLSPSSSVHSSQTGGDWNSITQGIRCASRESWSCDPLLSSGRSSPSHTDNNSLCSEKMTSSPLLTREKRKFNTSSLHSRSITRSISLRKSKRPPPPPLRSDSLRRRPGRSKSSRTSSSPRLDRSPRLEHTTQRTPTSSPQTFHDPWVPRSNTKRRQSGLNCGTVTTFEPLNPECQAATFVEYPPSEPPPPSPGHAHVFTPGSPGSEEEGLRFTLNPQPAASSVAGLQRLASPSSGYSSQSNTPTPGTPVSSPLTPSSPLTASPGAFSLPPTSPFSSLRSPPLPLSPAVSSLTRTLSRIEGRPKPPVPERKSSLFSSLSSSFSSTSSLSSCTSSESSARHSLLPPPPPPPPLPEYSSPLPAVFYSPNNDSPPPLPQPAPSFTKLSAAPHPPPSSLPPPPPPPPPPLPPSSLPTPPPLPPSTRPPPPPYSYAIRQTFHHALVSAVCSSTNFPPPPTSPPPPPSSPLPPPSELLEMPVADLPPPPPPPPLPTLPTSSANLLPTPGSSPNRCVKVATPPPPLVTAQALQGVRLRSIKNQEGLTANATFADVTLRADTLPNSVDVPAYTEFKQAETGSQDACSDLGSNEVNITCALMGNASFHSPANTEATQPGSKAEHDYYNLTKSEVSPNDNSYSDHLQSPTDQRSSGPKLTSGGTPQDIQDNEKDMYGTLANNQVSTPNSPLAKMCYGSDKNHINTIIQQPYMQQKVADTVFTVTNTAERHTEDVQYSDSSYWTLSGTKQESHRESRTMQSESRDETETNDKNKSKMQSYNAANGDSTVYRDLKQSNNIFKSGSPRKLRSPEKPTLPKKPDVCILGLMASPEARQGPGGMKSSRQITSPSAGFNSQSQLPADSFCTPMHTQVSPNSPKHLTCTTVDKMTNPDRPHTTSPSHTMNAASLPLNSPADIATQSPASSPQMQKPQIVRKKPDLSLTSPKTTNPLFASRNTGEASKGTSGTCGILGISGISLTYSTTGNSSTLGSTGTTEIMDTTRAKKNTLNRTTGTLENAGTSGTLDTLQTTSNLGTMGIYGNCDPSGFMGVAETQRMKGAPNINDGTISALYNCGSSETWGTSETCTSLGNSGTHRATSTQTGATDPCCAGVMKTKFHKDDERVFHKRMMRSSLAEDEEENEKDRGIKTMMMMMSSSTRKKDKARKRRKRRPGRQLLMMSSTMEPSPSSSIIIIIIDHPHHLHPHLEMNEMRRKSERCKQSKYSLSSALSTDSLRGELSLQDLLIQEPEEEEEGADKRREGMKQAGGPSDADLFVSVSADQMFVSGRPRTTEDLFAVIHRSKRKMLGRRDSEDDRHRTSSSSSSSSPPVTPTDALPRPTRPAALRGQRSARSESFKALLLRKGTRSETSSRISAVERLRIVSGPATTTDLQNVPSLPQTPPPDQPQVKDASVSDTSDTGDMNAHLTLDVPMSPTSPYSQNFSMMFGWSQRDLTQSHPLLSSSSSSLLLPLLALHSASLPHSSLLFQPKICRSLSPLRCPHDRHPRRRK